MKAKTREFYLQNYRNISESDYDFNEGALLLLVHNTRVDLASDEVVRLFTETFGQKPNLKNVRELFRNNMVQKLWFHSGGFGQSVELRNILTQLDHFQSKMVSKFLKKVQPFGRVIMVYPNTKVIHV